MTAVFARSPLQSLPMAANRPTTRRRSVKHAFEDDDDAPAAKRPKTEMNGASKRTNGATKKAAKIAYDENDDGFQFTRRSLRRTTKAQAQPEPIPEEPPKPAPARKKKSAVPASEPEQSELQKRRRSARLSGDKEQLEEGHPAPEPVIPAQKRTKKNAPAAKEQKRQKTPALEPHPEGKSVFVGVKTPTRNELHVRKKRDGATKIMLPFADTPVITRNKEMRKASKDGHRRSSTGLRGRRASSLIDSGMSNALPHSEVEIRDFYKYIEQSLPEPRRMKQLLTWCGSRALPEKPSGNVKNANAIMAARAIQQELIDDFASKPELSDWFSREETAPPPVVKKPNPQNEKNKATLQELEEEVKRLEEEKAAWEALASSSNSMPPPPPPSIQTPALSLSEIDASLLDASQASMLASLQLPPQPAPPSAAFTFTTPSALQSHLTKLADSLEPNIDLFADGVHKIEQYRNTAERVADRVLGTAAGRLEERDKEGKEKVGSEGIGVGDVLRGLAGVLNES
ncbi:hypothetical protein BU26DRAFT_479830 [Trematosphaeria pertusa]|uniref:Kinetochore protein Mis13 n=1 Tax=Trematosphaeria pertusa TaxID=390896 RepID=A0A6A6IP66_9PLEO|nr:uncharacterized protein BU26DRAFT_479830 [Trematosphaeria pertusa]KAF2252261.1 hypothetical protein BU26DRAFT_479830 [Trematosphaeria pertusa]